jgi:hypothetical protein
MVLQIAWKYWTEGTSPTTAGFLARHGVYRVRSLKLISNAVPAQADGEFLSGGITEISVSPGALQVLLPRR